MTTEPTQGRPTVPRKGAPGVIRFTMGLAPDLWEWLNEVAGEEERTIQAQISYFLKQQRKVTSVRFQSTCELW